MNSKLPLRQMSVQTFLSHFQDIRMLSCGFAFSKAFSRDGFYSLIFSLHLSVQFGAVLCTYTDYKVKAYSQICSPKW